MTKDDFSDNLFWDAASVDFVANRPYVVQRVLERGTLDDMRRTFAFYGFGGVVDTAKRLRTLEPRSLSFISAISGEPKEAFRCYTLRQSSRAPWIY